MELQVNCTYSLKSDDGTPLKIFILSLESESAYVEVLEPTHRKAWIDLEALMSNDSLTLIENEPKHTAEDRDPGEG